MRRMALIGIIAAFSAVSAQEEKPALRLSVDDEERVRMALDTFVFRPKPDPGWSELKASPSLGPQSPDRRQEVYEEYCKACHGDSGRGDGPLAKWMVVKPRDFSQGIFKLKTTPGASMASDEDLFRSISVGFPAYGMPSFHHLDEELRWLLVEQVKGLVRAGLREELAGLKLAPEEVDEILAYRLTPDSPMVLEASPEVTEAILARGKGLFENAECAKCHGPQGFADGPSAETLKDVWDAPIRPRDFGQGEGFFKGGARPADFVRTVMLGIPGTPMPSFDLFLTAAKDQWALAHYLRTLVDSAVEARSIGWTAYFRRQVASGRFNSITGPSVAGSGRPGSGIGSSPVSRELALEKGCLSCHDGIQAVREKERPSLLALGGGTRGRGCAVCHEGNPEATTKEDAHDGLFPDPGYSWVVALGKGCGKCHSGPPFVEPGQFEVFPSALGGKLMDVVVTFPRGSVDIGKSHGY